MNSSFSGIGCCAVFAFAVVSNATPALAEGSAAPVVSPAAAPGSSNIAPRAVPAAQGGAATAVLAPGKAAPAALAPSLEISNVFDSQRRVWPDRVPPAPPPPPPPPPVPVADNDLQLYGVVIVGPVKRATVKLGTRFADSLPSERAFAQLSEGQRLGEFTVASITGTHIVLEAPGGKQLVYFNKKTDRTAGPSVAAAPALQPVQAPSEGAPRDAAAAPATGAVTPGGALGAAPGGAPAGAMAPRNMPGAPSNAAGDNSQPQPAVVAPVNIQNSLAAAIAAAQANASARPSTNDSMNPFLQKR